MSFGLRENTGHVPITDTTPDAEEIHDPVVHSNPKVSFHPSGVVNFAGKRSHTTPWREITELRQLCAMLFEHPAAFPQGNERKRDLAIDYPFDEDKPLFGSLLVGPQDCITMMPNARNQVVVSCLPIGRAQPPDILIHFALGHGLPGPWPRRTLLSWLSLDSPGSQSAGAAGRV